jgi:hypothetical protein
MIQMTATARRAPRSMPGKKPATTALAGKSELDDAVVGMAGPDAVVWEAAVPVLVAEAVGDIEDEVIADGLEESAHMLPWHV